MGRSTLDESVRRSLGKAAPAVVAVVGTLAKAASPVQAVSARGARVERSINDVKRATQGDARLDDLRLVRSEEAGRCAHLQRRTSIGHQSAKTGLQREIKVASRATYDVEVMVREHKLRARIAGRAVGGAGEGVLDHIIRICMENDDDEARNQIKPSGKTNVASSAPSKTLANSSMM